jgi:two-component system, sensor histidine kinase and response regulator
MMVQSDNMNLHGGAEILIVEDSPTQAEKLRYLLESNGYAARVAGNGRLALEAIRQGKPALVLSDIVMPEMDGYALCNAIKSDARSRDVPVILVTSLVDSKDIVRGLECGADSFVRKPYAEHYLLSRIEHVLMNQQLRREPDPGDGIALYLDGQTHVIRAERQQVLDLLISTYEQAVLVNEELRTRERQVNELNARMAQHAAQLEETNQEIARQNLELAQASRMKSEFLANMSHELRTPLNAIIGFSEALKQGLLGRLSPQQEESVGDIFSSGKHLLSLINDILDLSKIESGKMELDLAPTDVQHLLQDSLTVFKDKAITGRIRLRLEMEALGWALLDQRKTRQILYNLVSNAVKFTPEGGAVTLRMCQTGQPWRDGARMIGNAAIETRDGVEFLEICVIDTGIGISADQLGRLFQPFVQLDSGLSRRYEGTGLGLALVKKLVELQGGRIGVKSRPGRGSEFFVWLPYRAIQAPAADTSAGRG